MVVILILVIGLIKAGMESLTGHDRLSYSAVGF